MEKFGYDYETRIKKHFERNKRRYITDFHKTHFNISKRRIDAVLKIYDNEKYDVIITVDGKEYIED